MALIARSYPLIAVEKLKVQNMMGSACGTAAEPGTNVAARAGLNRAIADAGMARLV